MFKKIRFVFALALLAIFWGCDDSNDNVIPTSFDNGAFIINEGNFGTPNASVSFYSFSTEEVTTNVFNAKNNKLLGDVAQSFSIIDGNGYVVVNNSNKVEVVNPTDFRNVATITNRIALPRYMAKVADNKAYITNWATNFTGYVAVLDLSTNTVTDSIGSANFSGTEQIVVSNEKAYVSNSFGSSISVIDINADTVLKEITTTLEDPVGMHVVNGELWVLCRGGFSGSGGTKGGLHKIDPATDAITLTLEMGEVGDRPGSFITDGSNLFYSLNGEVYKMSAAATTLPTTALFSGVFYGLGVNPTTGDIYASKSNSFTAVGTIEVYNSNGVLQTSFGSGGVGPNGFMFVQ